MRNFWHQTFPVQWGHSWWKPYWTQGLWVYTLPSAESYRKFLGMLSSTPRLWWILSGLSGLSFALREWWDPPEPRTWVPWSPSFPSPACSVLFLWSLNFLYSETRIHSGIVSIMYVLTVASPVPGMWQIPNGSCFRVSVAFLLYKSRHCGVLYHSAIKPCAYFLEIFVNIWKQFSLRTL